MTPRHITQAPFARQRSREQRAAIRRRQADSEDAALLRWLLAHGVEHVALAGGRHLDCTGPGGARAALQAAYLASLAR